VGRRRDRESLVREDQVAAVVPRAARRDAARTVGIATLRRSRLLTPAALKAALAGAARAQGFDAIGIARPDAIPHAATRLRAFLDAGAHGDMDWMARNADRRGDPRALWPQARSVVMLGVNYGPDDDPLAVLGQRTRGAISVYAQGDDYHDVIKPRLKALGRWLIDQAGGGDIKVFVDTAPVMEKPLAQAAGLGWQGKHTNLVSRAHGSWLFLGAIVTTLDLPADTAERDHCGTCRACLDICPTAAFPAPYRLDARRCISYLTIEHKGPIPHALRPLIGNRIYGCDDCLAVCPWNKFAQAGHETRLAARDALRAPPLAELARLDDAGFRALFAKSAVKRIGRARFLRNVLIAAGNSGDTALAAAAERLLDDPSPLVRGAAVWALGRLDHDKLARLAKNSAAESDPDVAQEWSHAMRDEQALTS
jgi:epoxyqueuosine reductase